MKVIGVIPTRYSSTRIPGKPLADICGHPMVWWVFQRARIVSEIDEIVVATDNVKVVEACSVYGINAILTDKSHSTPTSRIHEVSTKIEGDLYAFISGDEPLIDASALSKVIGDARVNNYDVTNGMSVIKTSPEVIDTSNIKVVTNKNGELLYDTRSPIPFPKGGVEFEYKKFAGISVYSKKALDVFHSAGKGKLENIEECDLIRFLENGIGVKMVQIDCRNISVDTPKDLEMVRTIIIEGETCT